MATIKRFEDIKAWQSARALRRVVYSFTKLKNFSADFALVDQIRRAAISIGSNVAEGFERGGNKEFIQFLGHAKGSAGEVRDQLYCAIDENYITQKQFDDAYAQAEETSRLIGSFMTYLRQSELKGHKFISPTEAQKESARTLNPNSKP